MIKIKEIEIQFPKWWQTGLIIIAIITITIIVLRIEPKKVLEAIEHIVQKIWSG